MTFARIISFQNHISPKSAVSPLLQDWTTVEACMYGSDKRGFEGRNLEMNDNNIYRTNLPAC